MTKTFKDSVREILCEEGVTLSIDEATTRILALCKEMLVPAKSECFECEVPYGHCCCYVRNGIRQGLLKQLGEVRK